ncbi:unnamed protein product, partial [Staurois parvus]
TLHFRGRDLYVNNTDISSVSSCTLLCMALHSSHTKAVCLQCKAHTQHTVKEHRAHS